ncbi:GSCOCG00002690001-RA-CDS [Cotesia congregata]|nr:GSCOCG00002690001-RA-CDS [Cotesia congregata]
MLLLNLYFFQFYKLFFFLILLTSFSFFHFFLTILYPNLYFYYFPFYLYSSFFFYLQHFFFKLKAPKMLYNSSNLLLLLLLPLHNFSSFSFIFRSLSLSHFLFSKSILLLSFQLS